MLIGATLSLARVRFLLAQQRAERLNVGAGMGSGLDSFLSGGKQQDLTPSPFSRRPFFPLLTPLPAGFH